MYNQKNAINICDLLHVKHFEKYIYMVQDFLLLIRKHHFKTYSFGV